MDSTKDDHGDHGFEFDERWHPEFTSEDLWNRSEAAWAAFHRRFFDVIESAVARACSEIESLKRAHNPGALMSRAEFREHLRQKVVATRWNYRGEDSVSSLALTAAREFLALKRLELTQLETQKRWHRKFTDQDLWRDCKEAWRAFYERYLDEFESAVGFAFRIRTGAPLLKGDPQLDELLSEFLLRFHDVVLKKQWGYRGESALFSYMLQAARNMLQEKARKEMKFRNLIARLLERSRRAGVDSENRGKSGNDPEARGAGKGKRARPDRKALLACLLRLDSLDRQLLMKRCESGTRRPLPYAKVAEAFRMDADDVREHCRHAMRQMKDCLRRNS